MDNLFGNIKKMNKNDNTDIDEKKLDKREVLSSYSFDWYWRRGKRISNGNYL